MSALYVGRNATIGRESGCAENGCFVNWAFVPSMLLCSRSTSPRSSRADTSRISTSSDAPGVTPCAVTSPNAGFASEVHYLVPDHRQPVLADRFRDVDLPITERLAAEGVTLPCFPEMTYEEVGGGVAACNAWKA